MEQKVLSHKVVRRERGESNDRGDKERQDEWSISEERARRIERRSGEGRAKRVSDQCGIGKVTIWQMCEVSAMWWTSQVATVTHFAVEWVFLTQIDDTIWQVLIQGN